MTGGARPSATAAGRPRVGLSWAKTVAGCARCGKEGGLRATWAEKDEGQRRTASGSRGGASGLGQRWAKNEHGPEMG
jgi:hypothetical protein